MLMRDVSAARAAATSVMTEKHPPRRALEQPREIGRLHRDPRIGGVIDELQPLRRFVFGLHKKTLRVLATRIERASA